MKFHCERCKTRYSIGDEKVRGKILKIRCKNCEAVITVRETGEATASSPTGPLPAMVSGPVVVAPPPPARARAATPAPVLAPPPPPEIDDEWFVSVDGNQEGPFTLEQARRRVASRLPDEEMFAWREDFDGWKPVEEVTELLPPPPPAPRRAGTAQVPPPPPPARPDPVPAPLPAVVAAPSPAIFQRDKLVTEESGDEPEDSGSGPGDDPFAAVRPLGGGKPVAAPAHDDHFDFQISEASRVVRMPILPPPAAAEVSAMERSREVGLPGVAARQNGANGTPAGGQPAAVGKAGNDGRASASLALQIASISQEMAVTASAEMAAVSFGAGIVDRARPRRRHGIMLAGGAALVAILALVMVLLARRGDDTPQKGADEPGGVSFGYDKGNHLLASDPAAPRKETPAPAVPEAKGDKTDRKTVATAAAKIAPVKSTPAAKAESQAASTSVTSSAGGKEDTFDGEARPGELQPLTPDDVHTYIASSQIGITRCYERALKQDPDGIATRLDVTITVAPSGQVTSATLARGQNASSALGACVLGFVRGWHFRRSTEGIMPTEFPVVFVKR